MVSHERRLELGERGPRAERRPRQATPRHVVREDHRREDDTKEEVQDEADSASRNTTQSIRAKHAIVAAL